MNEPVMTETIPPPPNPTGDGRPLGPLQICGTSISLWAGALGAPAIWALQLFVSYAMVPWTSHEVHRLWILHALTGVFALLSVGCLALCIMEWIRIGRGWPRGSVDGVTERTRFLAVLGILSSALFTWVILVQGIAGFIINPGYY